MLGKPNNRRLNRATGNCHKEIDRRSENASWVAKHPGRYMAGFHIPKLLSPRFSAAGIVKSLQTLDATRRKETYNQDLGLPYFVEG